MNSNIQQTSGRGQIFTFSLAHLVNDMYMNQIQVLLPFFVLVGISISKGAFLVSVFTLTSSLLQPVFGILSDKKGCHWLVYIGTLWMAVMLGLMGLTLNYPLLLIIVALGGLGTAAFHPKASAMVAKYSQNHKTFVQAVFIASGNVGWALTPLLAVPLVQQFGLKVTPVFMVPGILISLLLWLAARNISFPEKAPVRESVIPVLKQKWGELSKIMLVVAFRSLTYFSIIAFLPLYLQQNGVSLVKSSRLVFLMLFTGSLGGLLGGFLADRYGRRPVIVLSLLLSTPMFYLFLLTSGWVSYVFLGLAGAFLLATFSVTVAAAHSLISKNTGLASGLTLGAGTGIGGLGVGLMGILVDYFGLSFVIHILISLPVITAFIGMSIKEKKN